MKKSQDLGKVGVQESVKLAATGSSAFDEASKRFDDAVNELHQIFQRFDDPIPRQDAIGGENVLSVVTHDGKRILCKVVNVV